MPTYWDEINMNAVVNRGLHAMSKSELVRHIKCLRTEMQALYAENEELQEENDRAYAHALQAIARVRRAGL